MDDPASYVLAFLDDGVQHSTSLLTALAKLLAVLFFVGANGFFVGAEFSLVSVRRPRLETRAAAGSKRAQAALRLLDNPTFFISATQLGITLLFLPSYSPNLNLIERLWKFIKRRTLYGRYHAKFADFQAAIQETINQLHTSHAPRLESLMTLNFQEFENVSLIAA